MFISSEQVRQVVMRASKTGKAISRKRALEFAHHVGMRTNNADPHKKMCAWTGKVLFVGKQPSADIVHDVAHYQCAPKSRRCRPDFGLGQSPDAGVFSTDKRLEPELSPGRMNDEEESASILGILWQVKLGIGSARMTFDNHSWDVNYPITFDDALCRLHRWGLISPEAQPLYRTRP